MALYKLADLIVELNNQYDYLAKQCREYQYLSDASADLVVTVTEDEIQQERNNLSPEMNFTDGYLESLSTYRKICLQMPAYDGFLFHGSVIDCGGKGIIFLADSGVGKTTHTMLWKQVYGEQMRIINGDKPIVRFFDGTPYAYGTPWAGKENYQCNDRVALTDLCFIERSPENQVIAMKPQDCVTRLMQQIIVPADPQMAIQTLQLLDRLLSCCRVWVIRCNISQEAAILAHDTILGE